VQNWTVALKPFHRRDAEIAEETFSKGFLSGAVSGADRCEVPGNFEKVFLRDLGDSAVELRFSVK
jgi:hypothetical protein